MKKIYSITILFLIIFSPIKLKAMDPVTISLLAPIAIEGAQTATPYIIEGLSSGGEHMLNMGVTTANLLLIPVGVGQICLMDFSGGLENICEGAIVPFKLTFDIILLPISFFGVK